jgi:hypothetical protein
MDSKSIFTHLNLSRSLKTPQNSNIRNLTPVMSLDCILKMVSQSVREGLLLAKTPGLSYPPQGEFLKGGFYDVAKRTTQNQD